MKHVKVVENGVEARKAIDQFILEGFTKDQVYILAHDKNRSHHLTEGTDTGKIGVIEEGIFNLAANVFRSRGDELRSKMESLNLAISEAEQLEREMDEGRVVVIATSRK